MCAAMFSLALIGVAGSASAHVTVSTPDAEPGGFGKIVLRVPTESDTASTTSITVTLPAKTPFAFVSTQSKPGWTAKITEITHPAPVKVGDFSVTKTASEVTWTADDGGIKPGQFDEFALSVGPVPKVKELRFDTTQRYSDGTTATWDQAQTGGTEPEHPAPTLSLTKTAGTPAEVPDGSDQLARWLAIVAIVTAAGAGLIGLRNNGRNG